MLTLRAGSKIGYKFMQLSHQEILKKILDKFPAAVKGHQEFRDSLLVSIDPGLIVPVLGFLHDTPDLAFNFLVDMVGVDTLKLLGRSGRFEVIYLLKSLKHGHRLQIKCVLTGDEPRIASVTSLFRIADWLEREIWDQFGIVFEGHPNLKRLLNHKDFTGHPLRKDYPIDLRQKLVGNDDLLDEMKRKLIKKGLLEQDEIWPGNVHSTGVQTPISLEELLKNLENGKSCADRDFFLVNLGPSHPIAHGILRLLLALEGETIVAAVPEIGYLHRGFEKGVEQSTYTQAIVYTDRLNYASPVMNNIGFCKTVEKLLGIAIPERAVLLRVIFAELNRIMDHLLCTGPNLVDLGALTPFWYVFQVREELYNIMEKYSGARLTYSCVRIGGMPYDVYSGFSNDVLAVLERVSKAVDEIRVLVERNRIFMDRCMNVGVIGREDAISYGFTGPCLRAAGVEYDLRKAEPYYHYDEFDFQVVVGTRGDTYDRFFVRLYEMIESAKIVRQALARLEKSAPGPVLVDDFHVALPPRDNGCKSMEGLISQFKLVIDGIRVPPGETYNATEAANGELGFYVVSDGSGKPYRVRVRPPCFMNYAAFEEMIEGEMVADLAAALGSMNVIGGEIDR